MSLRLRFALWFLVGAVLGAPTLALAQEEEDPSQLPEIAPREIEIRGQLEIAFPSLERQPLSGFAPSMTIPSVPTNRMPYLEPYKQELDALPHSLPEEETISQSLEAPQGDAAQGFLEVGTGRYFTRFAEGRLSIPMSSHEALSIHADYLGTEGFTAFESASIETPSDDAAARLHFESRRDPVHVGAALRGDADRYTLYGATPDPTASVLPAPEREGLLLGASVRLQTLGTVRSSLQASYDHTRYSTQFVSDDQGDPSSFEEDRLGIEGALTLPIDPFPPQIDATFTRSGLGGDVPGGTAYSLDAGGALPLLDTDPFSLQAGARFLAFEAPAAPHRSSTLTTEATYVLPSLRAEWQPTSGATLHLQNTPTLQEESLADLYGTNPYVDHAPSLRPTLETTDAEAGLTFFAGPVRISTTAGYRYAPSFQYFEAGGNSEYTEGIFQTSYDAARIIHGGGQIALQGLDAVQASVGVTVRDGELTEAGTIIPNFAPLTADAMLSVSFADDRGLVQANGHLESPRHPTTTQSETLDTYFAMDLEGSYRVTSLLEVVARADNLAFQSPTKWPRYPRPPAMISAGLRIQW